VDQTKQYFTCMYVLFSHFYLLSAPSEICSSISLDLFSGRLLTTRKDSYPRPIMRPVRRTALLAQQLNPIQSVTPQYLFAICGKPSISIRRRQAITITMLVVAVVSACRWAVIQHPTHNYPGHIISHVSWPLTTHAIMLCYGRNWTHSLRGSLQFALCRLSVYLASTAYSQQGFHVRSNTTDGKLFPHAPMLFPIHGNISEQQNVHTDDVNAENMGSFRSTWWCTEQS